MGRRAAFLDRDGVLIEAVMADDRPGSVRTLEEAQIARGAAEGCRVLREAGWTLVCVTNQPDVARGLLARADVDQVNAWMARTLDLDLVLTCPHDDADGCDCRKPRPGLLTAAAEALGLDLGGSVMVGDRWRDVEAGRRAGCATVFIDRGYREQRPEGFDHRAEDVLSAVGWILSR